MKNTRRGFLSFLAAIPAALGAKAIAGEAPKAPPYKFNRIRPLPWPSSRQVQQRLINKQMSDLMKMVAK